MPQKLPEAHAGAIRIAEQWIRGDEEKDKSLKLDVVADNMVLEIPFSESGRTEEGHFRRYVGREQIINFIDTAFAAEKAVKAINPEYVVSHDARTVFVEVRGQVEMSDGKDYRNRYVLRFDIEDGKIVSLKEFYNPIVSAVAFGREIAGQVKLDHV